MRKVVIDWHKRGTVMQLEKKWGIKPSPYLEEMHRKYLGS